MSTDDEIKQKISDLDRKITEIKRNNEAEVRQKFLDEISRLLDEANTQADNKDIINAKITKGRKLPTNITKILIFGKPFKLGIRVGKYSNVVSFKLFISP